MAAGPVVTLLRTPDPDLAAVQVRAFCPFTDTTERSQQLPAPARGAVSVIAGVYEYWDGLTWSAFPPPPPVPWTPLTFTAPWQAFPTAGWQGGAWRRVGELVTLRGLAQSTAATPATTIVANLPAGARPPANTIFSTIGSPLPAGTAPLPVRLNVLANGNVQIQAGSTAGYDWLSLEAVRFAVTS